MHASRPSHETADEVLPGPRVAFGESPFLDPRDASIIHVDTLGQILRHHTDGSWTSWAVPQGISFAVPSSKGGFVVGLAESGLCRFDPAQNALHPLSSAIPAGQQSNDATVDPLGRLIFGTRSQTGGFDGALIVQDEQGSRVVAEGFGLVNGLAVDAATGRLWVADTHPDRQQVSTYSYDLATGTLGAKQVRFDFRNRKGRPDGAALDSAGNLWLAEIGGGALVCLSPQGDLLREIALPVSLPTKPCFDRSGRLVVTTASKGIDLSIEPAAGHLLSLDVPGATFTAIAAV